MLLLPTQTLLTLFTLKYSAFLLFYILQGVVALFAGANLDNIFDIIDEYLAVTDMTGVKNLFGSFDNAANRNLAYYNVKLNFGRSVASTSTPR